MPIGTLEVNGTQAREGATCIAPPGPCSADTSLERPSTPVHACSPHHRPPPAGSVAIHVRRSAIEHARQEPKDEPRTRGRPALQSEVQDWAIRKTPSATIKATAA